MLQSQTSRIYPRANNTISDPKNNTGLLIPAFSSLLFFCILLTTVPPSVFHGDSGETITAAFTLGIQHPPGYPLFTLLGKIFCMFPLGDVSFRVYLLSLFLAMIDFWLIYFVFLKILKIIGYSQHSSLLSLYPSAVFIAGYTIWDQATTAKGGIYTLNIFFTLIISLILIELYSTRSYKYRLKLFYLFSFLFGLGLGDHHMSQFIMLPGYVFLVYASGFYKNLKLKNYITAFFFFLIAVIIYIYLPVRAKEAYLNWGDPSTLKNFYQTLTRWQYSRGEITSSLINSMRQIFKFFSSNIIEFAVSGSVFIIAGLYLLFKKEKNLFIYMLYNPAVFLLFTAVYLNLSVDRLYIMETYITPAYFPMSIFLGIGILWMAEKTSGLFPKKHLMEFIFFLAVLLPQLLLFYPRLDKSRYYYAYDYNRNMLLSVEDNGILFATGDGIIFPMWYLRYVKHYRTDVTLVGTAVLPMRWVRDNIKTQNPFISMPVINTDKIGTESTGAIINAIIRMNFSHYPIYFAYSPPEEGAIDPQLKLMPKASVFKLMLKNYAFITGQYLAVNKNLWKIFNLRGVFGRSKKYTDPTSVNLYINDYAVALNTMAQFCEDSGDYNLALDYFTLAHKFQPEDNEYVYNMGTTYFNLGNQKKSVEMFKASIVLNPKYKSAWYNLGVVYYKQNKLNEALDCFLQLKKINPDRKDIDPTIVFLQKAVSQAPK